MASISKIIGMMSCSIVLFSLADAARAGTMNADPCADRKTGMHEQVGCDKDAQAGIDTIKGEVLAVEGNSYIVERFDGKEVRLYPDAATEITPRIGRGDWIEAKVQEVGAQKHVMSIKQIKKKQAP